MKKDNDSTQSKQIEQSATEPKKARRELLGSGAMAAASMMFGLVAAACSDDSDDKTNTGVDGGRTDGGGSTLKDGGIDASLDAAAPPGSDASVGTDNDIAQLNALLTAEYKAITAYGAGATIISAAAATDPLITLKDGILAIATSFLGQHTLHAQALVDAITSLNGVPVKQTDIAAAFAANPPPLLSGPNANPTLLNVLKFAAGAERGAAIAYNNVIGGLEAAKFRFLASVIEGDESQHFIVLTALLAGLVDVNPANLVPDKVVPEAFVHSFGSTKGLDNGLPPNYFA